MSPVCKMADNERLTVDQMVKVVLFYAQTKSVVATQRRFLAHFGTRWVSCKQTIYWLSLGSIFRSMKFNSVPDVKCFCKNVSCIQSVVWRFMRHSVYYISLEWLSTVSLELNGVYHPMIYLCMHGSEAEVWLKPIRNVGARSWWVASTTKLRLYLRVRTGTYCTGVGVDLGIGQLYTES